MHYDIKATITTPMLVDGAFSRSYVASLNQGSLNQLGDLAAQDLVTASTLQGIGGMFKHDINSVKQRNVIGGHTLRNVLYMSARKSINKEKFLTTYIVAYTEGVITTPAGQVDPNAVWYINSITEVDSTFDHHSRQWVDRVIDTMSVLGGNSNTVGAGNALGITGAQDVLARPQDIVNSLRGSTVGMASNIYNATPKVSAFENRAPTEMVSSLINTYKAAKAETAHSSSGLDAIKATAGYLAESRLTSVSFIRDLTSITGEHIPNTFSLNNIKYFAPNLTPNITKRSGTRKVMGTVTDDFIQTSNVASMAKAGEDEATASTIIDSLTGLVGCNLYNQLTLLVTNVLSNDVRSMMASGKVKQYHKGNTFAIALGANSLVQGALAVSKLEVIINSFVNNAWLAISHNNRRSMKLLVDINIMGASRVSLSVDGGQEVVYNIDSYLDSNISSVITSQEGFKNLANATSTILGVVDSATNVQPTFQY